MTKRITCFSLFAIFIFSLSACQSNNDTTPTSSASLQVTAYYRERIMLLPGAELTVTLEDVSRADVPSVVLAKVVVPAMFGPPYKVSLPYEKSAIKPAMRYTVRAKITNGEKLMFTSTERIDPFAVRANGDIPVLMQRIGSR